MIEIKYELYDVTAKSDCTPEATDKQLFVDLNQINEEGMSVEKYATLERNRFVLDGSFEFFPEEPENTDMGFWSKAMSDDNGDFETPINLTLQFANNHSSMGLTFIFDKKTAEHCKSMSISWYDSGDNLLLTKSYNPDRAEYFCDGQVEDYRKVVITFDGTNYPHRFLRLTEIKYGALKVFGEDDIISANMLEEIDATSNELSINTLEFSVYSHDFALLDPTGLYSMLQQQQEISVSSDGTLMGTYYLDEPESDSEDVVLLKCVDMVGIMEGSIFLGGIYADKSVAALIGDIMSACDATYEIDPSITGTVSGWLPICTCRDALQQVAFAVGAIVDCSRSTKIKILPCPTSSSGTVSHENKVEGHKVKQKPLVTGVEVTAHNYVADTATTAATVYQDTLAVGTHTITFTEPYHSLAISGGTLLSSSSNYAVISVSTAGTVIITGKAYTDNTSIVGKYAENMPANAKANILQVTEATLVTLANGEAVAARIYDYNQRRYENEGEIELGAEMVGTMWDLQSMNGRNIRGIVEMLDIDLITGLAKIKIAGEAVDRIVD